DPNGARGALGRALAADPLNLDALRELIALCDAENTPLIRDGALAQAAREAQRLIDLAPDRTPPYHALARVLEWQGDGDGRQLALQAAAVIEGRPAPLREGPPDPAQPLPAPL